MVELAPESKRGLDLRSPLILAAGGYGGGIGEGLLEQAGALVTLPTSLRPRTLAIDDLRVLEFPGGLLLNRHGANPGLAAVLASWRNVWRKMRLPIILALASNDARQWPQVAARVGKVESIAALELELNEVYDALEAVAAVRSETDLPLLAKVPTERALEVSEDALEGGASALVVGRTPRGAVAVGERFWEGRMMGPAARPLVVRAVRNVAARFPETPVVASGGVHTEKDVQEMLAAGARAVEIDIALWRNPGSIAL